MDARAFPASGSDVFADVLPAPPLDAPGKGRYGGFRCRAGPDGKRSARQRPSRQTLDAGGKWNDGVGILYTFFRGIDSAFSKPLLFVSIFFGTNVALMLVRSAMTLAAQKPIGGAKKSVCYVHLAPASHSSPARLGRRFSPLCHRINAKNCNKNKLQHPASCGAFFARRLFVHKQGRSQAHARRIVPRCRETRRVFG